MIFNHGHCALSAVVYINRIYSEWECGVVDAGVVVGIRVVAGIGRGAGVGERR